LSRCANENKDISTKIPADKEKYLLADCSFNMVMHFEFIKDCQLLEKELKRFFSQKTDYRNKEQLNMFLSHFLFTSRFLQKPLSLKH